METSPIELDVLVVGAGLVGGSFALALAQASDNGLKVGLVEAHIANNEENQPLFDPRVVALTERSRKLLDAIGAWDTIANTRISPYTHMTVWDAEGTGKIEFDAAEVNAENLGHIVENRVIVNALQQQIAQQNNIRYFCPSKLSDAAVQNDKVIVTLTTGECIHCKLIVAADGAMSRIRERFKFQTREWSYDHTAIVTTIKTDKPNQATAWQRFMPTGPIALLPLQQDEGDSYFCSIVWSQNTDEADRLMALDDQEFGKALAEASEYCLGQVQWLDKRYALPLRQRHAVDYIKPRVALLGDAAHTIHPLAGQGVNLGFADASALVGAIEYAQSRNLDIGELLVLSRYQRARKPENLAVMAAMEAFKAIFASKNPLVTLMRNMGVSSTVDVPFLKKLLIKQARGN